MQKITVMVPVYHTPKRVQDIIGKVLRNNYPAKEVIIVVDDAATPEIESALEPYREKITIHYNGERLGKTASLNRVALKTQTDVFLMLDNDVEMPEDIEFLDKLAGQMQKFDLIEIPKEAISKHVISRMMAMEFLTFAMTSWTIAKFAKRSPSMNGAAFAVRAKLFVELEGFKAVVNEDMDFAARAFRQHAAFGYDPSLKVRNEVPDTLRDWLIQRKRWALNNILWLKENLSLVLRHLFKTPAFFMSTLLMLLPFVTYVLVYIAMKMLHLSALMPFFFMIFQHFHMVAGLFLWFSHFDLVLKGGLIPTLCGILIAGGVYFTFSRILKFKFNWLDFILYYFIYSPIWLAANVLMWLAVILKIDVKLDWKV